MPTALILGNSQAQGAGATLKKRLVAAGYAVTVAAKHGANAKAVLGLLQALPSPTFDLAVVFQGDPNAAAIRDTVALLSGCKQIYWYGQPPATIITNVGLAKKVFYSDIDRDDYWFHPEKHHGSKPYATLREDNDRAIAKLLNGTRAQYVNYRDLKLPDAVLQPTGVRFPSMPDGIHIAGKSAEAMFSDANWPPKPAEPQKPGVGKGVWVLAGAALLVVATLAVYASTRGA